MRFVFCLVTFFLQCFENVDASAPSSSSPSVVVTLRPIYGLVASLMDGIAQPQLLSTGSASAHSFMLSPTDVVHLKKADCIVWVGDSYELMMAKPLKKHIDQSRQIVLQECPDLMLLPSRSGDEFGQSCCHEHHVASSIDGHFWLSVSNAKISSAYIADQLSKRWPEHAVRIKQNLDQLLNRLDLLKTELSVLLEPVRGKKALVNHDSLIYMEHDFGFSVKGVIQGESDSPAQIQKIKEWLSMPENKGSVFFFEGTNGTSAPSNIVNLMSSYGAPLSPFDYTGIDASLDLTTYEQSMRNVSKQLLVGFLK